MGKALAERIEDGSCRARRSEERRSYESKQTAWRFITDSFSGGWGADRGILGQLLGQASLAGIMPYITKPFEIFNFQDIYLNLAIMEIHFGIRFAPNLISILGILIAAWIYSRF